jgi:hypothetical protein
MSEYSRRWFVKTRTYSRISNAVLREYQTTVVPQLVLEVDDIFSAMDADRFGF